MTATKSGIGRFTTAERRAAQTLIELALAEDLGDTGDVTSRTLIAPETQATVQIVARRDGVLAGLPIVDWVFAQLSSDVRRCRLVSGMAIVCAGERSSPTSLARWPCCLRANARC